MSDEPDTDLKLDEFNADEPLASDAPIEADEKTASDLAPVFDVPVNISAVLGRASMSVAQLLQLGQGSVLELDLMNINAVMHPAQMVGNASWIEATGGDFAIHQAGPARAWRA